jgi:hypothetical protein
LLISLAALSSGASAGQAEYGMGVLLPENGVICDRKGNSYAEKCCPSRSPTP